MVEFRREDGKLSRTAIWNSAWIAITSAFAVAVTMLPEIATIVKPEIVIPLTLVVKGVDLWLRTVTTQPMKGATRKYERLASATHPR